MLETPLRHLLDPNHVIAKAPRPMHGRTWPDETFVFGEHRIFGATARTLRHVLEVAFGAA